jgi:hypothetical protein
LLGALQGSVFLFKTYRSISVSACSTTACDGDMILIGTSLISFLSGSLISSYLQLVRYSSWLGPLSIDQTDCSSSYFEDSCSCKIQSTSGTNNFDASIFLHEERLLTKV